MKKNTKIDACHLRKLAGLFTINEVAAELNLNPWTAYNQVREGKWPPPTTTITCGVRRYYTRDEVERFKLLLTN
jgi:DNA-binding transcriptional MerR regulator